MYPESTGTSGAPIDRYVVQEYLAEGGMGAIYLGKKLGAGGFEKQVVLKQLLPEFTRQPEFIDLFLREARLSATLDHANIIRTIDLVTAGEEYFIVMEFLDGADLRTLLKRTKLKKERLAPAAAIFVAREILAALSYAHSKLSSDRKPLRLIHRDISPSNILISRQGDVKLTDFGIAKASTHNSVFYRVKGKVGYMSPEQARSDNLDARSDLYSLAVCLYEMLTGERLFVQVGLTTSAEEMYGQPIPLLSSKVPGIPSDLDKVMLKALSADSGHRYQTAGEFQEALLRVAHRHGLMISAPELADHLRQVAGNPDKWRELRGSDAVAERGTEIYDATDEGTVRLDVSELESEGDMLSAVFELDDLVDEDQRRKRRAFTSVEHLDSLKDIELTSMIKIADADRGDGAEPLVDLDAFGTIQATDSSPHLRALGDTNALDAVEVASSHALAKAPGEYATAAAKAPPLTEAESALADSGEIYIPNPPLPSRTPWVLLVLILLIGAGVAAAIGLSGPDITTPSP